MDRWSHFVNVLMLDRDGNRINRRNPQDIFTPLYDHQIPPGAAHVVHYEFKVPEGLTAPVEFRVRLRYRKFDFEYMSLVYKELGRPVPKLPIVDLCEDRVTLPVEGVAAEVPAQKSPIEPAWQRWNDYGIGYFLTADADPKRPGLLQAVQAFEELVKRYPDDKAALANGYLNLARWFERNGELVKSSEMLKKIKDDNLPAPPWTVAWFNGVVSAQNGHLDEAIKLFREILDPEKQDDKRKFHFNTDYVVRNELGVTLYKRSQQEDDGSAAQVRFLEESVREFERTLELDAENLDAHYWLAQAYGRLGESAASGGPAAGGAAAGGPGKAGRSLLRCRGTRRPAQGSGRRVGRDTGGVLRQAAGPEGAETPLRVGHDPAGAQGVPGRPRPDGPRGGGASPEPAAPGGARRLQAGRQRQGHGYEEVPRDPPRRQQRGQGADRVPAAAPGGTGFVMTCTSRLR